MTRPALAANDSREETRQSELQILLGALDNAAQAAKIGGHLRRILWDAVNQSNVSLAPAIDPRSTSSVLVNPSGSAFLSNAVAREGTVPAEVQTARRLCTQNSLSSPVCGIGVAAVSRSAATRANAGRSATVRATQLGCWHGGVLRNGRERRGAD